MAEKALSPIALARSALLQNMLVEQEATDAAVGDIATKAMTLSRDEVEAMVKWSAEELAAAGWTKDEIRIAHYSLMTEKERPYALRMAHERHQSRLRSKGDRQGGNESTGYVIPTHATAVPPKKALKAEDDE